MKKTVCRCPKCGSTKAYCDESRSDGGFNDSWEVSEDWLVDIELADGEEVPALLPPLKDGEYFTQQLARVREERENKDKS